MSDWLVLFNHLKSDLGVDWENACSLCSYFSAHLCFQCWFWYGHRCWEGHMTSCDSFLCLHSSQQGSYLSQHAERPAVLLSQTESLYLSQISQHPLLLCFSSQSCKCVRSGSWNHINKPNLHHQINSAAKHTDFWKETSHCDTRHAWRRFNKTVYDLNIIMWSITGFLAREIPVLDLMKCIIKRKIYRIQIKEIKT